MATHDDPSTPPGGDPSDAAPRGKAGRRGLPYTDDQSRVRRRASLAAARDVELPQGLRRQQGRALVERTAATDRDGRFEIRLAEVQRDVERRERLRGRLESATVAGIGIFGIATAVVAGVWLPPIPAAVVGLVLIAGVLAGRGMAARMAEDRGAEAWDWQAGRHRLLGNPSARVQKADAPPPTAPRS